MEDFEIDYKVTKKDMAIGDVIEIRLPRGWDAPTFVTPYNKMPADVTDTTPSYAFLSGSGAAAAGLDVIDDLGMSFASVASAEIAKEAGWIVEIELESIVKVGRTITLHYNNVRVQRHLTIPR